MSFAKKCDDGSFIDMMGFRIYRTHITIRRRVFKRIRRITIRIWKRIKTHQKVLESHVRKMISYWGLLKNSNSVKVIQKYHVKDIMKENLSNQITELNQMMNKLNDNFVKKEISDMRTTLLDFATSIVNLCFIA